MDQVQKWVSDGKNGSGSEGGELNRRKTGREEEDQIINGLMERLTKEIERIEASRYQKTGSYLEQDIDVPGLDVPERDG